jgi:hypothetical protein
MEWLDHSTMDLPRSYSFSVTLPHGLYLLGGYRMETSSSLLLTGSDQWTKGPTLPGNYSPE